MCSLFKQNLWYTYSQKNLHSMCPAYPTEEMSLLIYKKNGVYLLTPLQEQDPTQDQFLSEFNRFEFSVPSLSLFALPTLKSSVCLTIYSKLLRELLDAYLSLEY